MRTGLLATSTFQYIPGRTARRVQAWCVERRLLWLSCGSWVLTPGSRSLQSCPLESVLTSTVNLNIASTIYTAGFRDRILYFPVAHGRIAPSCSSKNVSVRVAGEQGSARRNITTSYCGVYSSHIVQYDR